MAKGKKKDKQPADQAVSPEAIAAATETTEAVAQRMEVANPAERAAAGLPDTQVTMTPTSGPGADVSAQVTQAWMGLLAMSTQQGASRRDIVVMTLLTAASIMDITAVNLWPLGSDLPMDELQGFGAFQEALGTVAKALQVLNAPVDLQSIQRPAGGAWVWHPQEEAAAE